MEATIELKGLPLLEVNPIERRANTKIVQMNGKSYLIGGMTAEAISNQIYEFRLNRQYEPERLEWREIHFDNNLFSPRNSFSACAGRGRIYIWGGLEFQGAEQKALSDLIQIDVDTGKMRLVPLKNKIKIHSASLFFDETKSQLIAYGGSDQNANHPAYLYTLSFTEGVEEYEWEKHSIACSQHQGYIWQHSANFSTISFFNGENGRFLTVVGGCRFPHTPYNSVVEIDLQTFKVTNSLTLSSGLVSHDSVERDAKLFVFGGSNGGDFNNIIFVVSKGGITKLKGHRAIGCSCCVFQGKKMLIYGGVCGEKSINGGFIYQ